MDHFQIVVFGDRLFNKFQVILEFIQRNMFTKLLKFGKHTFVMVSSISA